MVRSFTQWTKTLSFPARLSPAKASPPSPDAASPTPDILDSEKDVMNSIVYCIHHKEGCKWSDQLRKLKAHLNTCKYDTIPCTNLCGAQIPRVLMEDHLRYTCPSRVERCEHCSLEMTGPALETHPGTCPREPLYCENKCGARVQRRLLSRHKERECPKRLVPCRFCSQPFVGDTLSAHQAKCARAPLPCPNRCGSNGIAREELEAHVDSCTAGAACPFKEAGCRFRAPRGPALDRHVDEAAHQHLGLVCALVARQGQHIAALKTALSRLSLNYTGTLVWKIADYSTKMSEAQSKEGMELISPPWYTSQFGYKLQASLFPNGNGAGENTHISLYIKILPGEYDALLKWPFSHSVSFTLFDQSEKACNIVESFVPDPTWENFQRPSKEPDTLGFGFPRFVSHETLTKRSYLKEDTLFIRIKVDPSKIVAV